MWQVASFSPESVSNNYHHVTRHGLHMGHTWCKCGVLDAALAAGHYQDAAVKLDGNGAVQFCRQEHRP